MNAKETVILFIFVIFTLPLLIKISLWAIDSITNPSSDNIGNGVELIVESAIPWWIQPLEWLSDFGKNSGYFIIGFLIFLTWIGEVESR